MNNIPVGYKQTEVGIIPEDWEVKELDELFQFQGGSQQPKETFIFQEKQGYIRLLQIRDYISDTYESYIPLELARRFCNEDDIMIGRYGPPIFQILNGLKGAYNVALMKAIPTAIVSKKYGWFVLKQETLFQFIEKLSQRSSGQTGVDLVELRKYKIPFPPIHEQAAIATALSDVDALISTLDKLIAKKRLIKQGAMQELLSGKKRLAGFSDEWEVKTFGEIFDFLTTATYSRAELSEYDDIYYIHYGDIHTKLDYFLDFEKSNLPTIKNELVKKYPLIKDGDIIMADASEDYDGICKSVEVKNIGSKKAISGLHTFLLRDNKNVFENGFKAYIQSNIFIKNQNNNLATGLKVYGVSKVNLKTIKIPIPPKEEQTAIAQILSDMDSDILALETQRNKTQAIKQGMMQNLLTGKIRLI